MDLKEQKMSLFLLFKVYFISNLELLDDDDEVLTELVDSLSRNFIELVGG